MLSVIIPTFNESDNIGTLISYLRDCRHGKDIQIIIADSPFSSDDGFEKAKRLKATSLKCKKAGRAVQMNEGAKVADNDILYFLHADTRPPLEFVDEITERVQGGCGFGIFSYKFDSSSWLLKANAYFTRYDGLFAGGGDQSLFITKSLFSKLDGYNEKKSIMEDFDLYKRLKKSGSEFCIIKNPLLVSARKYKQNSWLKVNFINLRIFLLYLLNASEESMIRLNKKLVN